MGIKMNHKLYVVGGMIQYLTLGVFERYAFLSCCEEFDLVHEKWHKAKYRLPQKLAFASASISPDESFAIIIGGRIEYNLYCNDVIFFDEKEGFRKPIIKSPFSRALSIPIM